MKENIFDILLEEYNEKTTDMGWNNFVSIVPSKKSDLENVSDDMYSVMLYFCMDPKK